MNRTNLPALLVTIVVVAGSANRAAPVQVSSAPRAYLGFDRNEYPGDNALPLLRKTFAFAGYWLNPPPGATRNTWVGKRRALLAHEFGFAVLFNGRLARELRTVEAASALGRADAMRATSAAAAEGFPRRTIIFLDQEQGGRMLPEQKAYIYAWVDAVSAANYRAGIYCSGIAAQESPGVRIVTADDIRAHAGRRDITYWVTNDACPPSPGCAISALSPAQSGTSFAEIWQYAQSPRRTDVTRGCPSNYDRDGSCYAPGHGAQRFFLDLDTATSPDPSHGATDAHK